MRVLKRGYVEKGIGFIKFYKFLTTVDTNMASAKQIYYTESLIGRAIINEKFTTKKDIWDKLDLLPHTKLEDLDNKQMSEVIKTLSQINEQ
ncbi:hypothetical protein [Staphylococcus phage SAP6]|nr:hypothetical protein [Staphylococcus phage StAP1]WAW12129.1 hypothetical protein [Staphylococcus phage SAP6]